MPDIAAPPVLLTEYRSAQRCGNRSIVVVPGSLAAHWRVAAIARRRYRTLRSLIFVNLRTMLHTSAYTFVPTHADGSWFVVLRLLSPLLTTIAWCAKRWRHCWAACRT